MISRYLRRGINFGNYHSIILDARCVPKSQCSDNGVKANSCAVDLRGVDLRQDYDEYVEEEEEKEDIVCCGEDSIITPEPKITDCENGFT